MCILGVAINIHPKYPFILVANRDEFYDRDTATAHFWPESPSLLAGRDLVRGGTWLGITKEGRFAALTNVRDGSYDSSNYSRGMLVKNYLLHSTDDRKLDKDLNLYDGFNLIYGNFKSLHYLSNYHSNTQELNNGIHVLSNAPALSPTWPKTEKLKKGLMGAMNTTNPASLEDELFKLLTDEVIYSDDTLPNTGVGLSMERTLSSIFIKSQNYGTRSSTVILVDKNKICTFIERSFVPKRESRFTFKLEKAGTE
ncbi:MULTISPECIES: NRDE family protein [Bacillaceae]|uniref:NRDE family protein n=1 Tax=Evansella alkalicola TaxID=745819 RepID=A0ABS6JZR4_9BACI|nr:NRDE family protein [Litchfieldia alkalitelluris]MBU9723880.1 NRDE family protein [Bacillus alkalicola]